MRLACGGCREAPDDGSCWRGNSMLLLLLILPRAGICWVGISMLELLLLILPEGRMPHVGYLSSMSHPTFWTAVTKRKKAQNPYVLSMYM